jgi:hypothetical protein
MVTQISVLIIKSIRILMSYTIIGRILPLSRLLLRRMMIWFYLIENVIGHLNIEVLLPSELTIKVNFLVKPSYNPFMIIIELIFLLLKTSNPVPTLIYTKNKLTLSIKLDCLDFLLVSKLIHMSKWRNISFLNNNVMILEIWFVINYSKNQVDLLVIWKVQSNQELGFVSRCKVSWM